MAARLLCSRQSVILTYARSLRWFCIRVKEFSSQGSDNSNERSQPPDVKEVTGEPIHTWLNIRAGIFGPVDQRLPLPGDIGLGHKLDSASLVSTPFQNPVLKSPPDVLTVVTNHEQQLRTLNQVSSVPREGVEIINLTENMPHPSEILECRVQDCPELVKKDFLDLFPGRNIHGAPLSVLTLSQKTEHDMSGWSEEMENEREELIKYFVQAADEICSKLKAEGYWADFIDPTSGRPFHGPYTNATLFETDERYRHMGFCIEDLGCCKVVSHRLWGTHVFVGAIFTSAPVDSEVLDDILNAHQKTQETLE
ncbi:cobalamin trafficking protein CblD [Palaemon carinicauda]|uniref:cobalamin trafficking protein CblD n=1 Tax=Palaemon carinicauda TaxID=392227 RepID=UPI0035B5BCFE